MFLFNQTNIKTLTALWRSIESASQTDLFEIRTRSKLESTQIVDILVVNYIVVRYIKRKQHACITNLDSAAASLTLIPYHSMLEPECIYNGSARVCLLRIRWKSTFGAVNRHFVQNTFFQISELQNEQSTISK